MILTYNFKIEENRGIILAKIMSSLFLQIFFLFLSLSNLYAVNYTSLLDQLMKELCSKEILDTPLNEIYGFNQADRDTWVKQKIATIEPGSIVLDLGAGTCPYREYFINCEYFAQDFMKYKGEKLGGTTEYGDIDFICDISHIPVADASFDVILCTEVLEHVANPFPVLQEMSRLLKPGGKLILTVPFACGLHQEPYHFYSGFTPYWYNKFLPEFGFTVLEVTPNNGFYKMLSQESLRVIGTWELHQHHHKHELHNALHKLFGELLPRFLFELDEKCPYHQFTVGYHVEAIKR